MDKRKVPDSPTPHARALYGSKDPGTHPGLPQISEKPLNVLAGSHTPVLEPPEAVGSVAGGVALGQERFPQAHVPEQAPGRRRERLSDAPGAGRGL